MNSNLLLKIARPFLSLWFMICLLGPASRAQTVAALNGVYNGKYTCGQGATNLKLSVVVSPIGDVSALFTFYLPADAPKLGYTYSLHGQYDPQTANFSLTPVRWETEHPANLGMVGMDGALSGDRLSGRITGGRCTTFDLARDKVEMANIAAVITAQKNGGKPVTPSSWTAVLTAQASARPPATSTPATQAKPPAAIAPPATKTPAPGTQLTQQRTVPPAAPAPAPAAQPQPSQAAAKAPRKDLYFCYTTKPEAPVVYFSDIFDLPYSDSDAENMINVALVEDDFGLYLLEKVGYDPVRSKADMGVYCRFLAVATGKPEAMSAAAAEKKKMESATATAKKKVVETGWKYVEEADTSAGLSAPPPAQPPATQTRAARPSTSPSQGLKWEMVASGRDTPKHPWAAGDIFDYDLIFASVTCNQSGMSVIFETSSPVSDHALPFVWSHDEDGKAFSDVVVTVDGRRHVAKGFPNVKQDNTFYNNELGIFFYEPNAAQEAVRQLEFQTRTGTGLDKLIRPMAEAEVNAAAASSAGPVTNLFSAKSIQVQFSVEGDYPYLELNPQDPVLHKYVADCVKKFGIDSDLASAVGATGLDRERVLAAEARYKTDPVPENAMRMPVSEITTRWAGHVVIATGTVSRVETKNGNTILLFEPAGNQVLVCFPEGNLSGLFGMRNISELSGKAVEVRGRIDLPVACSGPRQPYYGAVVPAAIPIEAPSQMKVLDSASVPPAANTGSGTRGTPAAAQKEPIAVQNPDGTITFQKPAAQGQEEKGLVIPPQVVTPTARGGAPNSSEAARAKAAQEQQERIAREQQERLAQQQAAQQQARQRAEEAQRKAQQAQACAQELMRRYPDGGGSDPEGYQKAFLACVQAQQAQPAR
jgi:hypothetical protein